MYEVTGRDVRKYYSFGGQTVAMDDGSGLQYFLSDHLGSIVAVTDASGTLISQQRYLPFGGVRDDAGTIAQTDYGYTGQRLLDSGMGGLMDYKARFYSPYLNRFVQPDSILPDPSNPQAFNRYSYVLNSPIIHNDPTGHCASGAIVDTVLCVAAYVGLFFIVNSMSDTPQNLSPQEIEARQNSFYFGVGLLSTSLSVKSLAVEALSNTYDCINGYCDPNIMLPGSTAVYSKLNHIDAPNLSLSQAQKLDRLARENNCSITICGGFAETSLGIENRRVAYLLDPNKTVGPVPDWRNTGIPKRKDLDYWTPFGVELPKPVRDGLEEIFGIPPRDNYNKYPGNKFSLPPGSLTFPGNGTAIRKIAPWQKKINWE
jgi:RHS repeat-associated protein